MFKLPPLSKASPEARMSLLAHLKELRQRLLLCAMGFLAAFIFCYSVSEPIFNFLARPLADALAQKVATGESIGGRGLIYTGLAEVFTTYVKVAFFAAIFLSFPLIASQVWIFIAPALYRREKKAFLPFFMATPLLFLLGSALAYYAVFPLAWSFFLSFERGGELPIAFEPRVGEYLVTSMKLMLAFGLCFQLPIVLNLLARMGLIKVDTLKVRRKYAFLIIVIVAALLTPPDFISPIGLIIPLYGLYEVSILLIQRSLKEKKPLRRKSKIASPSGKKRR